MRPKQQMLVFSTTTFLEILMGAKDQASDIYIVCHVTAMSPSISFQN